MELWRKSDGLMKAKGRTVDQARRMGKGRVIRTSWGRTVVRRGMGYDCEVVRRGLVDGGIVERR